MRRVSHYEHAFRAGRGDPVERVPHPEYPDPDVPAIMPPAFGDGADGAAPFDSPSMGVDAGVDASIDVTAADPTPAEVAASIAADVAETPPAADADPAPLDLKFSSSNIRTARLDPATGIVEVTFNSGKSYRYANFSIERMVAWRGARSAGSWFNANVKNRPEAHPLIVTPPAIDGDGK